MMPGIMVQASSIACWYYSFFSYFLLAPGGYQVLPPCGGDVVDLQGGGLSLGCGHHAVHLLGPAVAVLLPGLGLPPPGFCPYPSIYGLHVSHEVLSHLSDGSGVSNVLQGAHHLHSILQDLDLDLVRVANHPNR